jgi:hypothetical protein
MILTEQEPLVRVQVPPGVKLTVPEGVVTLPGEVSVTFAVHDVDWPTVTDEGTQATAVLVPRVLTVTMVFPPLPLWDESPL